MQSLVAFVAELRLHGFGGSERVFSRIAESF